MLGLMALPFIFASCEKDHGTSGYGSYGDSDWKKYDVPTLESEEVTSPIITSTNE